MTTGNYCHVWDFSAGLVIDSGVVAYWLVVVLFVGSVGVLELLKGFRDLTP